MRTPKSLVRGKSGLTLVEVIVATAVLMLFTVAVISMVVVSRGIIATSSHSEPDASAAQFVVDTLMTDLSSVSTPTVDALETDTGATCMNGTEFSPTLGNNKQFKYGLSPDDHVVEGYVIYVRVYGDDGKNIFLKAFARTMIDGVDDEVPGG